MKNKFIKNLFLVLVFTFLFLPIVILIVYSFNSSKMNILFESPTLYWYKNLFNNTNLIDAFKNTILIAVISTLVSTVIGTISAYALFKYEFPFKKLINRLIYIPIVIPEIVLGISLLSIYTLMKLKLGIFSIILSHIAFSIPFVVVSVRSTLSDDTKIYEEAAKDLGASDLKIFTKIILPIILPGVISGCTLAFTLSMDDVVISYFTSGPGSNTLPLYIYSMIKSGITPDVNALSSIMLVFTFVVLIISSFAQARRVSGK